MKQLSSTPWQTKNNATIVYPTGIMDSTAKSFQMSEKSQWTWRIKINEGRQLQQQQNLTDEGYLNCITIIYFCLTLTVLVTTIDALQHFETG